MNDEEFVRRNVKEALPRVEDAELATDLWPKMLRRLEDAPPSFGWVEALLAGALVATVAAFPDLLPALLYHL